MKNKHIFAIVSAAALLFAGASCTPDNLDTQYGNYITLNISSKTMETRAAEPGIDSLNENVINSVYYYFYKKGDTTGTPVIKGNLGELDHKGTSSMSKEIPVATGNISDLFTSGVTECESFIVANPPKSMETTLKGSPTLAALRRLTLDNSLKGTQSSFTMVYDSIVKQSSPSGNIMTVEASMQRLASKLTVKMNTTRKCTDEVSSEWTSVPAKARMTFYNAFGKTNFIGDFDTLKVQDSNYKTKYFDTDAISFGAVTENADTLSCYASKPVYSYPVTWDFVGGKEPYVLLEMPWINTGAGKTDEVTYYYKIFLDAKELKMNTWCHLTVNIDELGSLTPDDPVQKFINMDYMVLNWNEAFASGNAPTTVIDDPRYLMMNDTIFKLYDQNVWNIPYTSSHDCEIVLESYEKHYYGNPNDSLVKGNSRNLADTVYNCTLDESLITFTHVLNNDFNSYHTEKNKKLENVDIGDYDVVKYIFKFTIWHKDNHSYKQEITVIQYPAIYIEAQPNTRGTTVYKKCANATAYLNIDSRLAPIVDEPWPGEGRYYGYGADPFVNRAGEDLPGNINGNMYVVTSSVAPTINGVKYMLGDPRELEYAEIKHYDEKKLTSDPYPYYNPVPSWNFKDDTLFTTEYALYMPGTGTKRTLQYYYPTRTDASAAKIISPKFRVASSWGATQSLSAKKAVARCAAYQEDGYPAGRWRVPTAAEMFYIIKLSSDHIIPMLFGNTGYDDNTAVNYWCSTGYVSAYRTVDEDGNLKDAKAPVYVETDEIKTPTLRTAVRCVYDDWYWENRDSDVNANFTTLNGRLPAANYNTRVWGDMPR